MKTRMFLLLTAMLVFGVALYGHHSIAGTYDQTKEIKIEGKIVQFLYRNPHAFVRIAAPDDSGAMHEWAVEWGGAAALAQQGVNRDTFKIGDVVTITGNPGRNVEDHRLKMNTLHRKSDGFGWGTRPGEKVE